ncbi:unnamed protein product [Amoebophrya sp. A25]|nr:unnamed protein product [Amoebophrya sp. A25]|eukprot:GSA25T00016386001.1
MVRRSFLLLPALAFLTGEVDGVSPMGLAAAAAAEASQAAEAQKEAAAVRLGEIGAKELAVDPTKKEHVASKARREAERQYKQGVRAAEKAATDAEFWIVTAPKEVEAAKREATEAKEEAEAARGWADHWNARAKEAAARGDANEMRKDLYGRHMGALKDAKSEAEKAERAARRAKDKAAEASRRAAAFVEKAESRKAEKAERKAAEASSRAPAAFVAAHLDLNQLD